jgi:hypothetical protein
MRVGLNRKQESFMDLDHRGKHPNSLANLTHDGRPQNWGEGKKKRNLTVTETGWQGVQAIAKEMNLSISELLEKIGRGEFKISP